MHVTSKRVSSVYLHSHFSLFQDPSKKIVKEHFLKKPGSVNRIATKDLKIQEFKFQILLRLELSWVSIIPLNLFY